MSVVLSPAVENTAVAAFVPATAAVRRDLLILAALCALLFFQGLGAGELYRNEGLRALLARQMLDSGDWIVPTLYGQPIFTKPPGMYWAIALCSLPFGVVTEWTARLPSALAASLTVLLFYWFFGRHLGRRIGLLAALLLPLSVFWLERVPSAEIDMLQVMWVAASLLFFLRSVDFVVGAEEVAPPAQGPVFGWMLAALLCVAAGTLTKWTAPAFFYASVVPFLWLRGRLRWLFSWQHLVAASVAVSLVLAWVLAAVWHAGWESFYGTVSREALQHLAPGHGRHFLPLVDMLLHPLKILGANLPWSLFALWTLRTNFRQAVAHERFLLQALHCWLWPNLVFWSLASEHSLRHSAPLFPAFSGLAALACRRWTVPGSWRARPILVTTLAAWLLVKAAHVHLVVPQRAQQRQACSKGERLARLVPPGEVLYLLGIKDEGLMFYFGRPALRLPGPGQLPAAPDVYCLVTAREWAAWSEPRDTEVVEHLQDAQGEPIVLLRLGAG